MQGIKSTVEIKGIPKGIKSQSQLKNNNPKIIKYSDENKFCDDYLSENNAYQVIKPIPIKNYKDDSYLDRKRMNSKVLSPFNNFYKNNGRNEIDSPFKSNNAFQNLKMKKNQVFNPDFFKYLNFWNFSNFNTQENEKFRPVQIKVDKMNIIINNYINADGNNKKKLIFGISSTKSKNNKNGISKNLNPINSIDNNKTQTESKDNSTTNASSKKFEIFKTKNSEDNDNISYDEIKKITLNKKRGRKALKESKRQHNALDQDNIIRKIQVHFLSFIIYFCNDLILTFLPSHKDLAFKNIQYELKKTVNHAYIENLKKKNIGDILQLKASPKNKKFSGNINKITFDKICQLNPFLKAFFEMSYLDMFNNYYCQNQREIDVGGYKVKLSQRTRLFIDLVSKNVSSAEKIKEIAEEYFINKRKNISPIFVINKKNNII